ncbi:unnamed protein product, partial [Mesorhabditis spiculigera]
MVLSTSHRCFFLWLHLAIILLVLVIYLDKEDEHKDPLLLFGYLGLSDGITILALSINIIHNVLKRRLDLMQANINYIAIILVFKEKFVYLLVIFLKIIFQAMLYLKLTHGADGPGFLLLMIPLWGILAIVLFDLTKRIVSIQTGCRDASILAQFGEAHAEPPGTVPMATVNLLNH